MIRERIGDFRVEAVLGAGGMGTVYRATGPGGAVALKVVLPHLLEDAGALARFRREAAIGATIRHPNVVATLASGEQDVEGRPLRWIAMEYVEGRTLRGLLDEMRRVPEDLCRRIGCEVARGLAAIHAAGVVHRDVKPENVLVTRRHEVKVMDLGIARGGAGDERVTATGAFVGSVQYAAPEQFAEGRLDDAEEAYRRATAAARALGIPAEIHRAEIRLCGVLFRKGRLGEVVPILERWIAHLRSTGDVVEEAVALGNMGSTLHALGRYDESRRIFEQCLAVQRRLGDVESEARSLSKLANALRSLGRLGPALECIRRSIETVRAQGTSTELPGRLNLLGLCSIAVGDVPAARDAFGRALGEAVMFGARDEAAWGVHGLALTAAASGSPESAVRLARRAVDEAKDTDPLLADVAAVHLARLLAERGDAAGARTLLREAKSAAGDSQAPSRRATWTLRWEELIRTAGPDPDPAARTQIENDVAADPAGALESILREHGPSLDLHGRMELHLALARLRSDPAHARAARDLLDTALEGLGADARRRAISAVTLHREVHATRA